MVDETVVEEESQDDATQLPPDAIPTAESQSFVVWLINTQRYRRDEVGHLSGVLAGIEHVRYDLRYATFDELFEYMSACAASGANLGALRAAYEEWSLLS